MLWKRVKHILAPGGGELAEILPNVLCAALKPARARVMGKKLYRRWKDQSGQLTPEQNLKWIETNVQDFAALARRIDADLWIEAIAVEKRLKAHGEDILKCNKVVRTGIADCGGGYYPLLYFVARHILPSYIVETGVAAGYSSQAFLEAIEANGKGRLFSTDFPLFRGHDPQHAVGILVDERLKKFWELHMEGDELGLPSIARKIPKVDMFHYDSDKSYRGRSFAVSAIKALLHPRSVFVMDDIQDDSFFHDYVKEEQRSDFSVFMFSGKYVGVLGSIDYS